MLKYFTTPVLFISYRRIHKTEHLRLSVNCVTINMKLSFITCEGSPLHWLIFELCKIGLKQ